MTMPQDPSKPGPSAKPGQIAGEHPPRAASPATTPASGPPLRWPLLMILVPRSRKFWAVNPADLSYVQGTEEEMTLLFDKLRVVVTGEHLSVFLYAIRTMQDLVIEEGRTGSSPMGGPAQWKLNSVAVFPPA